MTHKRSERGQTVVIIAISMLVLVVVAAFVIDGGSLYLNRRKAQTAADAAALAGAREMCVSKGNWTSVQNVVTQYAVTENGATAVESVTLDADGRVVVQVRLETQSFFARALGEDVNMVRASSAAGCFSPRTTVNLLPVAWTCRPPVGSSPSTCTLHSIPYQIFESLKPVFNFDAYMLDAGDEATAQSYMNDLTGSAGESKMTYVLMDSNKFDPLVDCQELNPAGQINCDFNNDGIFDVEGGANRGWLLLDGNGASDLSGIMLNGYPAPITIPQWFPGKSGVSNSVFINAHSIRFNYSLVPVFNAMCSSTTPESLPTQCPTEYQTGDLIASGSGSATYYRVAGFAPFVVTCVSKGASEPCPGKAYANLKSNVSTIEGYFVSGYVGGTNIDPNGFDLGIYVISLTK